MVYFGERDFHRRGTQHRDRWRVLLLFCLLAGAVVIYVGTGVFQETKDDLPPVKVLPTKGGASTDPSSGPVGSRGAGTGAGNGTRVGVIDVDPVDVEELHDPPQPFVENPLRLVATLDRGTGEDPGTQSCRDYLFHRWRSEVNVPMEAGSFPTKQVFQRDYDSSPYRGKRYKLTVEVVDAPLAVTVEPGDSGVRRHWEMWVRDGEWLYRMLFLERHPERLFEDGTEWEVVVDFHRMHEYIPRGALDSANPKRVVVPEVIARNLTPLDSGFVPRQNWVPLLIVGAIGLAGVLVLVPWAIKGSAQRQRLKIGKRREE